MDKVEPKRSLVLVNLIQKYLVKKEIKLAEIGVYRGLNAKFVINTLLRKGYKITYYGFDLFEDASNFNLKKASPYVDNIIRSGKIKFMSRNAVYRTLMGTHAKIRLIKGDSKITISKYANELKDCDFFYIDGGHDYASVSADWLNINRFAQRGSIIVFDDTATPGVQKLINEIEKTGIKIYKASGLRKYYIKQ